MLVRYQNADELADPIEYLYHTPEQSGKATTPWQSFLSMFRKGNESTQDLTEIHHFTDSMTTVPETLVKPPATRSAGDSRSVGDSRSGGDSRSVGGSPTPETSDGSDTESASASPAKKEKVASTSEQLTEDTSENISEYKDVRELRSEPPVVGDAQPVQKGSSEVDTLPPANEIKPRTTFSGKEKRKQEKRTTDLPSPMPFEEPEGVH